MKAARISTLRLMFKMNINLKPSQQQGFLQVVMRQLLIFKGCHLAFYYTLAIE